MFEIRIICNDTDTEQITKALPDAFTVGSVRPARTRDGSKVRLYITAEHRSQPDAWPTPEVAYASAPSILSEISWTARTARERPVDTVEAREFWLRKAAVLDRIALVDEAEGYRGDAGDVAAGAARHLMDVDSAAVTGDPRGYVRQQYAAWRQ